MEVSADKVLAKVKELYKIPRPLKKSITNVHVDTIALALKINPVELLKLLEDLEVKGEIILNRQSYSERAKNKNGRYGTVSLVEDNQPYKP